MTWHDIRSPKSKHLLCQYDPEQQVLMFRERGELVTIDLLQYRWRGVPIQEIVVDADHPLEQHIYTEPVHLKLQGACSLKRLVFQAPVWFDSTTVDTHLTTMESVICLYSGHWDEASFREALATGHSPDWKPLRTIYFGGPRARPHSEHAMYMYDSTKELTPE